MGGNGERERRGRMEREDGEAERRGRTERENGEGERRAKPQSPLQRSGLTNITTKRTRPAERTITYEHSCVVNIAGMLVVGV